MLLGESSVGKFSLSSCLFAINAEDAGKTSLLVRFKDDTFLSRSFIATVRIDFRNPIVTLGDKKVNLQLLDTVRMQLKYN